MVAMLFDFLEFIGDYPSMKWFFPLALASLGGAVPLMRERARRRGLERGLPEMLDTMAQTVGANESVQAALAAYADSGQGPLGDLARTAVHESRETTFEAAMTNLAVNSRSAQVQRSVTILLTAIEQDSPLRDLLQRMAEGIERLNDLMDQRDSNMGGASLMMKIMVGIMLPAIIATVTGLFASPASGIDASDLNSSISTFLGAATMISVAIGGRMLGRFQETLWQLPLWGFLSMFLYSFLYIAIGNTMGGGV